jgi:hypothetical protein
MALARDTRAVTAAVPPDPVGLGLVKAVQRDPAPRPPHPIPPKVRGLRRMISVLKHL